MGFYERALSSTLRSILQLAVAKLLLRKYLFSVLPKMCLFEIRFEHRQPFEAEHESGLEGVRLLIWTRPPSSK